MGRVRSFYITNTSAITYNIYPPPSVETYQLSPTDSGPTHNTVGTYTVTNFDDASAQFEVELTSDADLNVTQDAGGKAATVTVSVL